MVESAFSLYTPGPDPRCRKPRARGTPQVRRAKLPLKASKPTQLLDEIPKLNVHPSGRTMAARAICASKRVFKPTLLPLDRHQRAGLATLYHYRQVRKLFTCRTGLEPMLGDGSGMRARMTHPSIAIDETPTNGFRQLSSNYLSYRQLPHGRRGGRAFGHPRPCYGQRRQG